MVLAFSCTLHNVNVLVARTAQKINAVPDLAQTLIVCPTYNERDNIAPLVARVVSCAAPAALLFVDDGGDDGTAEEIVRQQQRHDSIFLLAQQQRSGLAQAYLAGFAWGLARTYDCFVTMDADLSHDPAYLPTLLKLLDRAEVAIGSRYVAGGGARGWSLRRRLLSRFGSLYARTLLRLEVHDLTSGFMALRRRALEELGLAEIESRGYVFQIELKYRAVLTGCTLQETPIMFVDRQQGKSKLTLAIVLEAALHTWQLRRLGRRQGQAPPRAS